MAYDEKLARRIRNLLEKHRGLAEKKMFGGLCFMLRGHMCCGIVNDQLVIRTGPLQYEDALAKAHVHPMDFTGRPLKGFVYVAADGFRTAKSLAAWIERGVQFIQTLPPK